MDKGRAPLYPLSARTRGSSLPPACSSRRGGIPAGEIAARLEAVQNTVSGTSRCSIAPIHPVSDTQNDHRSVR